MTTLAHPSFSQSGMKFVLPKFDFFFKEKRHTVEASEVELTPEDANCWFYLELVLFKDTGSAGFHFTVGHAAAGPVSVVETDATESVMTIVAGNMGADGKIAYYKFNRLPDRLLTGAP